MTSAGAGKPAFDGHEHVYNFEIHGTRVSGVACTDCADATTLAFIQGTLESNHLRFVVNHVRDDGSTAYQDHMSARIENHLLVASGELGGAGAGRVRWTMRKDPRGPAPFASVAVAAVLPQPSAPARNVAAYGTDGQLPPAGFKAPRGAFGQAHQEDFGLGVLPFHNVLTAHLAGNELRLVSAIASNLPMSDQPFAYFAFSMIGPVAIARTTAH